MSQVSGADSYGVNWDQLPKPAELQFGLQHPHQYFAYRQQLANAETPPDSFQMQHQNGHSSNQGGKTFLGTLVRSTGKFFEGLLLDPFKALLQPSGLLTTGIIMALCAAFPPLVPFLIGSAVVSGAFLGVKGIAGFGYHMAKGNYDKAEESARTMGQSASILIPSLSAMRMAKTVQTVEKFRYLGQWIQKGAAKTDPVGVFLEGSKIAGQHLKAIFNPSGMWIGIKRNSAIGFEGLKRFDYKGLFGQARSATESAFSTTGRQQVSTHAGQFASDPKAYVQTFGPDTAAAVRQAMGGAVTPKSTLTAGAQAEAFRFE